MNFTQKLYIVTGTAVLLAGLPAIAAAQNVNVATYQTTIVKPPGPTLPRIELFTTDDRATAKPGETLTYRISIRNNTDNDITNVKIVDHVPAYLVPTNIPEDAEANVNDRTIVWNDQTISAQSEITFSFQASVEPTTPNGYDIQNEVVINGPGVHASASDATRILATGQVAGVTQVAPTAPAPAAPAPVQAKPATVQPVRVTAPTGAATGLISLASIVTGGLGLGLTAARQRLAN